MTWVLLLVVCSIPSDLRTCEDRVLAYKLGEAECHIMAAPLYAQGQVVECVQEAHDVIEDTEEVRIDKRDES